MGKKGRRKREKRAEGCENVKGRRQEMRREPEETKRGSKMRKKGPKTKEKR